MENESVTEQPTKVVNLDKKANKQAKEAVATAPAPSLAPKDNMYLISEKSVNQLLNAIGELPGLTWKQTNPLIVFIQQNVTPFKG